MPISENRLRDWQLREVTQWRGGICFGESELFGPVVLKRSEDHLQLQREYEALSCMAGPCCKVYALEEGTLLEERIIPGNSLREVGELERRLGIFVEIWNNLHNPALQGITYLDWIKNACEVPVLPESVRKMGRNAEKICEELFDKYPERMLLHGDLHHDNILRRQDGRYAVIDPKGVIGPRILDLPRFLLNEDLQNVKPALETLSARLEYPLTDLIKAYYMEAVLANMWLAEDGLPLWEAVLDFSAKMLEEVYGNQKSGSFGSE